ncbi:hypothetical protein Tco_1370357 [Tanacetum coccineum]
MKTSHEHKAAGLVKKQNCPANILQQADVWAYHCAPSNVNEDLSKIKAQLTVTIQFRLDSQAQTNSKRKDAREIARHINTTRAHTQTRRRDSKLKNLSSQRKSRVHAHKCHESLGRDIESLAKIQLRDATLYVLALHVYLTESSGVSHEELTEIGLLASSARTIRNTRCERLCTLSETKRSTVIVLISCRVKWRLSTLRSL